MDLMTLAAKIQLDSSGFENGIRESEGKMQGFGNLLGIFSGVTAKVAGMANIDFGHLPPSVRAVAFRNPEDMLTVDLGDSFYDVERREIVAPQGTKGFEHHRLYWRHPDVADWLVRASIGEFMV